MPNPRLSILVVDDAKFSSAMIGRVLTQAGYLDIRYANNATQALEQLEERSASVLLADWLMPGIDGLELTAKVRQLDEAIDHYTYIILLTGKEGENVLIEAFDRGVDDFISKAAMHEQLMSRVFAADRLCNTLQRLIQEKRLLTANLASLEQFNLVDTLTGLGNRRYLEQKMSDSLRQIESRGGAMCYLQINIKHLAAWRHHKGQALHDELLRSIARRIQQLVRPLDVVVRLDDSQFALLTVLNDLQECSANSFKRLFDGLNLKAFRTSEGFITLKVAISLVGLDAAALPQRVPDIMNLANEQIPEAHQSGRISALKLPLTAHELI